ncbi:unnamed protein product [Allacma fusca]|uniref:Uncharacterized protein n=1 Tax=Allacma fusca TaxID=39272 RepID=A0A8J2M2B2_9HEXA|nr:unnamed protein product [Allacma fusca]
MDSPNSSHTIEVISTPPTRPPKDKDNPYKRDSQYTKPGKLVASTSYDGQNVPHPTTQYAPPTTTPAPDVNIMLLECESYMNWLSSTFPSGENLKFQIDILLRKKVFPREKFEFENLARYDALEYIANLGALCYFYVELNNFREAALIIEKTREVVIPCIRNGFLPSELVDSFDYVWVYVRLHASIKEWETTNTMHFFPEIDLTNVPKSFVNLAPKVKAGILGLKYYFWKLQKVSYDEQIDLLKQAISFDRSYFEWHLCLQLTLRRKRKGVSFSTAFYPNKLSPNHPRCMLANIILLADIAKFLHVKDPRWTVLKYGEFRFHSMLSVKGYIQEQASKIMSLCPKSVEIPSAVAEIFSAALPSIHRNQTLAKDYLEQGLKNFPNSLKLNYLLGIYYLTVECNYLKAEEFFRLSYSLDEKDYPSLISLIQILMRKKQKDGILELIDKALAEPYWDSKQRGGFHFFRGLTLCCDSLSKSKAAADEFIKGYQYYEKALIFHELPNIHRRYGWPQWELDTKLTFEKIRQRVKRAESAGLDPERKIILNKILQEIDMAALSESRTPSTRSRWQR